MLLEISTIIVAIAKISLGSFVLIKKPRSRTHQLFSLFSFFIFAWVVTNYFALVSEEKGITLALMRLVMALVTAQAIVVLLFSITFPSRSFTIKKRWILLMIAESSVSNF